tara:strand:+ start:17 stop:649 length:633 start_codon:yes stop_codon:yes gene_type:complete
MKVINILLCLLISIIIFLYNKNIIKTEKFYSSVTGSTVKYNKPIIGAYINYNKYQSKITAIKYLYDNNKIHNSNKYEITSDNDIGDSDITDSTIKYNFNCQPNSAVYKIKGCYDSSGIKGLKFYCQDINTGKTVKTYNNNNRFVKGVTFGIEPKPDDENYNYNKVECNYYTHKKTNKTYPTFISTYKTGGAVENKNITNLKFDKCVLYKK